MPNAERSKGQNIEEKKPEPKRRLGRDPGSEEGISAPNQKWNQMHTSVKSEMTLSTPERQFPTSLEGKWMGTVKMRW